MSGVACNLFVGHMVRTPQKVIHEGPREPPRSGRLASHSSADCERRLSTIHSQAHLIFKHRSVYALCWTSLLCVSSKQGLQRRRSLLRSNGRVTAACSQGLVTKRHQQLAASFFGLNTHLPTQIRRSPRSTCGDQKPWCPWKRASDLCQLLSKSTTRISSTITRSYRVCGTK